VSEGEWELLVFAEVGEPVPGEHEFAADNEFVAERLDGVEEGGQRAGMLFSSRGLPVGSQTWMNRVLAWRSTPQ
jgi:hypothetical protein